MNSNWYKILVVVIQFIIIIFFSETCMSFLVKNEIGRPALSL